MSNRRKLTTICIALMMSAVLCFGVGITASAKNVADFTKTPQYVDGDFVVLNEQGQEDGTVLTGGELSFVDAGDDYGVILMSKTRQTAPYTVEFSLYSNTLGYPIGAIMLGVDDSTVGGMAIQTAGGMLIDYSAGGIVPWGGSTIYDADGETPAVGNFMVGKVGGYTNNAEFLFKFEVLENGWVNVYYDFASSGDLTTLRNVIKATDGGEIDVTKEGYFAYIPRVTALDAAEGGKRTVQYVSIDGDKTQFNAFDSEKYSIVGDESKAVITRDFRMNDNNNATVVSKFAFTDEGLTNDDDIVFDVTFVSSRAHMATSPTWGLAFGMDGASSDIANAARYEISVTETRVYDGATAKDNSNGAAYATNIYNTGGDITIRLVATKDGTLKEYRGIPAAGNVITDLYTTYTGLDFNGRIAFYSRKGGDTMANDGVLYKNISIAGNVKAEILGVKLDESVFAGAEECSNIILSATVTSYPQTTCNVVYSVTQGDDKCELEGNALKITGNGTITVRATSADDATKYDEYTFEVRARVYEDYVLTENFESLNAADWKLNDTDGNVTINEGLYFKGDNVTEDGGSATLVSNVYFLKNEAKDVIFDITFTSGLLSAAKHREASYSWGLLFGMKTQTAKAGDDNVGYLKVDFNNTYVYSGKTVVAPEYKTDRTSAAGDVFFETPYDITLRAVGKANGTLELYRGYSVYESVETLFATYSGLDFNGYVAFTTDSSKAGNGEDDYQIRISDVVLSGSVEIDDNYEIVNVEIDEKDFSDVIVSEVPLTVKVTVNAIPNLSAYREYTLSVVSGNAELGANGLVIKGDGSITLRAASVKDPTKFDEFTFTATKLVITDITVNENNFKNLNSDSQPVQLVASVECNMIANKYQAVKWTVVSGNVEIVEDQLRILGAGDVQLKVESVYGDFSKTINFTVADADEGQKPIDDGGNVKSGCKSVVEPLVLSSVALLAMAFVTVIVRKSKERKDS